MEVFQVRESPLGALYAFSEKWRHSSRVAPFLYNIYQQLMQAEVIVEFRMEGGVGGAVGVLAQGLPLHHTVLDGFNLPPLAVLLIAGACVLPAGAEQVAVHEVVVVAYLPLAVHFAEEVEGAVRHVFPMVVLTVVELRTLSQG